jgi:hypothetical protein
MLVTEDTEQLMQFLASAPRSEVSFQQLTPAVAEFGRERGWTPMYTLGLLPAARDLLTKTLRESPEQARARLVHNMERLRLEAAAQNELNVELKSLTAQADLLIPKTSVNLNYNIAGKSKEVENLSDAELWEMVREDTPHDTGSSNGGSEGAGAEGAGAS